MILTPWSCPVDPRGLGVTQNAYFLLWKQAQQLLFMTFCDTHAGIEVSLWTHGGRTDGGRTDRRGIWYSYLNYPEHYLLRSTSCNYTTKQYCLLLPAGTQVTSCWATFMEMIFKTHFLDRCRYVQNWISHLIFILTQRAESLLTICWESDKDLSKFL